jgi:hypothetical protein
MPYIKPGIFCLDLAVIPGTRLCWASCPTAARDLLCRSLRSVGWRLMYYKGQDRGNTKEQSMCYEGQDPYRYKGTCMLLTIESSSVKLRLNSASG